MIIPAMTVYDETVIFTRREANTLLKANFAGIKKYTIIIIHVHACTPAACKPGFSCM